MFVKLCHSVWKFEIKVIWTPDLSVALSFVCFTSEMDLSWKELYTPANKKVFQSNANRPHAKLHRDVGPCTEGRVGTRPLYREGARVGTLHRGQWDQGPVQRRGLGPEPCTGPPVNRKTDRHDWKHYLPQLRWRALTMQNNHKKFTTLSEDQFSLVVSQAPWAWSETTKTSSPMIFP